MAAEEKKGKSQGKPVTDNQRFNYIGFDVFPGIPKDLFKSDAEKTKFVDRLVAKREKGDILREDCTLMEERVSYIDRLVLTVASVVILATLFVPWYSAYNVIVEEKVVEEPIAVVEAVVDSAALAVADSGALFVDSAAMLAVTDSAALVVDSAAMLAVTDDVSTKGTDGEVREGVQSSIGDRGEQVLHSYIAKKKIRKEYSSLTGIGSLVSIGSVGSKLFSSGLILILTTVMLLVYTLLCVGLPAYTLYGLYGQKGNADQLALQLKKMLKFNWIPIILFIAAFIISFLGGSYGFDTASVELSSIGDSYGPGVFLGSLSYGVLVSLAAFILVAVKGVEI